MSKRRDNREPVTNLSDSERLKILNEHAVLEREGWKSMDATKFCLHCDKEFSGRSVRIYESSEFSDGYELECGTPGCDGSPIDWSKKPWWRGQQ